jgi:hypothetical protein
MNRGGHAGHMTQLIVERMAALDGPATVDEITTAVAEAAHVPWNYIFQRYQQYLCQANKSYVTTDGAVVTYEPDPELGWSAPGFDPLNPADRRKALRYVVNKRLGLHESVTGRARGRRRGWAVRDPDDRWRLNPDESQMPKIRQMNGEYATFDAETRAEISEGKAAQVAAINRSSDRHTFDQLDPAAQATLLRWLTDQLVVDRGASIRVRPILNDWRRRIVGHDAAFDKLRDLLCRDV